MAERQRFAPRMIQPGNPMQFSPTVQGRQGDAGRSNNMKGMAQSLLSLSDSFAGAFKAGAEVSDAEYRKQLKIEESIKEEQKTVDILRGKFTAMQRGLQPQGVLQNESEAFVEGYKTQIYTQKIEDNNEYIKSLAPNLANKIFARHSTISSKRAKTGEYMPPLAEYASVFIQKEKDGMLQGYENDPVAWKVYTEKGLDFNPIHEALSGIMGTEVKERRNTVLAQRVIRNFGTRVMKDYGEYEAVDGIVALNIQTDEEKKRGKLGTNFYVRDERQNAFLQDLENRLKIAVSPDDPVFNALDFTFTSKASDGIGFDKSQAVSTNNQYKTVSQRYYKLVESLRVKQEALENEQTSLAKTESDKNIEQVKVAATQELNDVYNRVLSIKTVEEADKLDREISSEDFIKQMRYGTTSGAGITYKQVVDKLAEIRKGRTLNPSLIEPSKDQEPKILKLTGKLEELKGRASVENINTDTIERLKAEILPFSSIKGGPEMRKLLGEVVKNQKEYQDKVKEKADEEVKKQLDASRQERIGKLWNDVGMWERGEVAYDLQAQRSLSNALNNETHGDFKELKKHFNKLVKDKGKTDKLTLFENNGVEAVEEAQELVSDPKTKEAGLQSKITSILGTYSIKAGDKKEALKLLYDRLFEVREATSTTEDREKKIKFRQKIFKASEDKGELEKLVKKASENGYSELQKEAQGYINVLNTREYNVKIYGQRLVENRVYNEGLYKERIKETREYGNTLRNIQKEWTLQLKALDQQIRKANLEEARKYGENLHDTRLNEAREYSESLHDQRKVLARKEKLADVKEKREYALALRKLDGLIREAEIQEQREYSEALNRKRGKLNEQKRIDIRNEKRAWTDFLRKKYKDEDEAELSEKQKTQRKAFNVYIGLSEELAEAVAENDKERIKKVRDKYLLKTNNATLGKVPALDEVFQQELKNANIDLKIKGLSDDKDNTAFDNRKKAEKSKEEFDIEKGRVATEIHKLLSLDTPDILTAESLISSRYKLQKYDTEKKELIGSNPPIFSLPVILRLQEDVRVAKHNHEAETTHKSGTTNTTAYVSILQGLHNYPTQDPNETISSFEDRQYHYYNVMYETINNNLLGGTLSESTHTRLKKSLDRLEAGGEQARLERIKNNPKDPIQTYTKKLYNIVGKTDPSYFSIPGSVTWLPQITESRNELYAEVSEDFDTLIYNEFNTNKEFRENESVRRDKTEEIYLKIIGNEDYKSRLDTIKNQLDKKGGKAGTEFPIKKGEDQGKFRLSNMAGFKKNNNKVK